MVRMSLRNKSALVHGKRRLTAPTLAMLYRSIPNLETAGGEPPSAILAITEILVRISIEFAA
jgi:hypothetical protein